MDGVALLDRAREAGVRVEADGDRLIVRGPGAAEGLAKQLLAHKPDVLAALGRLGATRTHGGSTLPAEDADAWTRRMREGFAPIRYLVPTGCLGQAVCSRLGPCHRHLGGQPCRVGP